MRIPPRGSPDDWFAWLTSSSAPLRKRATLILGGLEPTDDVPVEPLVGRLRDGREDVVFWALVGVARLGARARAALPDICRIAVAHEAFGVRQAAIGALVDIGPGEPDTIATLRLALRDGSPYVRREALEAIIEVPQLTEADLGAIAEMARDEDETVADWSEIALRNIRLRRQRM